MPRSTFFFKTEKLSCTHVQGSPDPSNVLRFHVSQNAPRLSLKTLGVIINTPGREVSSMFIAPRPSLRGCAARCAEREGIARSDSSRPALRVLRADRH